MSERCGTTSDFPRWYVNFQAAVILALPRPDTISEDVALGWKDNGESLTRVLRNALVPPESVPPAEPASKFALLVDLGIIAVPDGYNHATRLAEFKKEHKKEFYFFNDAITDKNFSGATNKLVPGRKFRVKVFQITQPVSSEDCLVFLRTQNAVLVGAQGASLAYEQAKDQLPIGKWSVSFDKKDALWKDSDGCHRVPFVFRRSGGDWSFGLGLFGRDWSGGHCLLCFCDFSA